MHAASAQVLRDTLEFAGATTHAATVQPEQAKQSVPPLGPVRRRLRHPQLPGVPAPQAAEQGTLPETQGTPVVALAGGAELCTCYSRRLGFDQRAIQGQEDRTRGIDPPRKQLIGQDAHRHATPQASVAPDPYQQTLAGAGPPSDLTLVAAVSDEL